MIVETMVDDLSRIMADQIGHGMREKVKIFAVIAVEYFASKSPDEYLKHMLKVHLELQDAYRRADNNAEAANVLRLYVTDYQSFKEKYVERESE